MRFLGLVLDAAFDLVAAEEAHGRRAVVLAVEVLVLNQPEAAGLEEVVRRVAVLDAVAGRSGGPDGVALFVPRGLRSDHPLRCDRPFVTQRVIASAEILPAEISARLAVEGVVVVVDRAGIGARILEKSSDQRMAGAEVVGEFGGTEVPAALGSDDLAFVRAGG